MAKYVANIAAVKVPVGAATGNRVAHILRRGEVVPEGVDETVLKDLLSRKLIKKLEEESSASSGAAPEFPAGDPTAEWSTRQLDAWGAKQDPVVKFGANQNKTERLEQIAKLKAADQS